MRERSIQLRNWLFGRVSIAPLVVFRIVFGALLLYSTYRTYSQGWIHELYIDPTFHFAFFPWVRPLPGDGMYYVFGLLGVSSLGIMLGFGYRICAVLFFLLFTYVELIDKTYYLNHYYLVSILSFWMIWVPAHRWFSMDLLLFPSIRSTTCARWQIWIFRCQLSIVYFFAGLAKVNYDWLYRAQPMATWLPGKHQLPVLGSFMHLKLVAYLFSWAGCVYDLTIWIFLLWKKTRVLAYIGVLVFHIMTGILFPRIGMFPYIMITSTLIFFSSDFHERLLSLIGGGLKDDQVTSAELKSVSHGSRWPTWLLIGYMVVQLFLPLRYLMYPGHLFWNERGYRLSWRVMLMEKNGYTSFIVRDPVRDVRREVDQSIYLTPFQEQQLRSQPDMMIQFGRYIGDRFVAQHGYSPEVYVKSRISLNARRSQVFTDENYDIYNNSHPFRDGWIQAYKR
ncbi:MAG: HTTM domain-containing protein [Bacteroidota bacterium]